jgi:hypothetical protein
MLHFFDLVFAEEVFELVPKSLRRGSRRRAMLRLQQNSDFFNSSKISSLFTKTSHLKTK